MAAGLLERSFAQVGNERWLTKTQQYALRRWLSVVLGEFNVGGISDRHQEIHRRRRRKKKMAAFKKKLKKATVSERGVIADKIRKMSPGSEVIIAAWG
ncbi:MAG TPA: DUF6800 family protein, partial [Pirellulales bacterium]